MAYGLHWEWRGFGMPGDVALERVAALAAPSEGLEVVDRYIWTPHISVNLKVRSWAGSRRLKVKRMIERIAETGVELWAEHPDDDYELPMPSDTATRVLRESGLAMPFSGESVDEAELVERVRHAHADVHVVSVRKCRSWAVICERATPLQVERTDILEPQRIVSLGIEDGSGLTRESPKSMFEEAHQAIRTLRDRLAPHWRPCNYPSAVAIWARGGVIEPS